MLHYIKQINDQIVEEKSICLDSLSGNSDKANEIFKILNLFNKEKIDEDTEIFFIKTGIIITAYKDGTFGGEEIRGSIFREGYELNGIPIDNIICLKCESKNKKIQINFTGKIDNDTCNEYKFNLNIENIEKKEDELFDNFINKFKEDYNCSAGALDVYISFCTNFGVDSIQPIFKAMLECMKDIKEDKSFTDRKGAIDYLKNKER